MSKERQTNAMVNASVPQPLGNPLHNFIASRDLSYGIYASREVLDFCIKPHDSRVFIDCHRTPQDRKYTMFNKGVMTGLTAFSKLGTMLRGGAAVDKALGSEYNSLAEFTRVARVEPLVMLEEGTRTLPYITDVLQTLTSIFAGYYMQAVSLEVNVGSIETRRLLEKFNPNRQVIGPDAGMIQREVARTVGLEDYKWGLPDPFTPPVVSMEAVQTGERTVTQQTTRYDEHGNAITTSQTQVTKTTETSEDEPMSVGFGRDPGAAITQMASMVVGVMLNVNIESNGHTASIPVTVRLMPNLMPSDVMLSILSYAERDTSAKARYHAWRSGELSFIRDIVLCQDLIDAHRETLRKDRTGIYAEILKRRNQNTAASAATGNISIATASNIVVMTSATAKKLEARTAGKLSNAAFRARVFQATYVMLLVVIDTEFEQVTIYTRGLAGSTTVSVKALKNAAKGSGPDVGEILRAYQLGQSPRF